MTTSMPLDLDRAIPFWPQMSDTDIGFCVRLLRDIWRAPGNCIDAPQQWLRSRYSETVSDRRWWESGMGGVLSNFWWADRDERLYSPYIHEIVGKPQPRLPIPNWMKSEPKGMALRYDDPDDFLVCHYCGENTTSRYHYDHALPISRGGINHPGNLRLSCPKCNLRKGVQTESEFGWWDHDRKIYSMQEMFR